MATPVGTVIASWGARLLRVRWFVRAPIALYRCRLGGLFGTRLLMLEHIGRSSGLRRRVMLEVVDHPNPDTYVVVSGFGDRAQWFRNIEADPHVRVTVASHRPRAAVARRLTSAEASAALSVYADRHPHAWAQLRPVLEKTLGTAIAVHDPTLPLVALTLAPPTAPALA